MLACPIDSGVKKNMLACPIDSDVKKSMITCNNASVVNKNQQGWVGKPTFAYSIVSRTQELFDLLTVL